MSNKKIEMKPEEIEALFEKTKDEIVNNKNKPRVIIKDGVEYISLDLIDHQVGNKDCPECWSNYPKKCSCGGMVHASFCDESLHDYWLAYLCDKCGSTENES
jgi:hypothetical protein